MICLIDNVNSESYGFEYIIREIEFRNIESFGGDWTRGALYPLPRITESRYIKMTVHFMFKDLENEFENKKSIFQKKIIDCTLKFDDCDFYYKGKLDNISTKKIGLYKQVDIDFLIYDKYTQEVTTTVTTQTMDVQCNGTDETPTTIEITSTIDQPTLTITGLTKTPIVVKNIKANQKIVIDAENFSITAGGVNKFADVDLWEYPFLKQGTNHITLNQSTITLVLKYKPRYL